MPRPKKEYPPLPEFKTEEEEAEFWDAHSPLDYMPMRLRPLRVKKDPAHVSLRLSPTYQQLLAEVGARYHVGPSGMARMLIEAGLRNPEALFGRPGDAPPPSPGLLSADEMESIIRRIHNETGRILKKRAQAS